MGTMFDPTYVTGPVCDGTIVTAAPDAIIRRGAQLKVPVVIGATSADLGLTQAQTKTELFGALGKLAAQARAAYDPDGKSDVHALSSAVGADRMMVEPARLVARLAAAQGLPAYQFRFLYVAGFLRQEGKGATRASDVPYVFDTVRARYGARTTPSDVAAGKAAIAYWVAFAKQGDPNTAGLPRWPKVTATGSELRDFSNGGPQPGIDPWQSRLGLVEAASPGH